MSYCAFGSISECGALLDGMSDDSAISHLDRDRVKLLNKQEALACPSVVLVLRFVRVFFFACMENWSYINPFYITFRF